MDLHAAKDFILHKLERELPSDRTYHSQAHTWDVYLTAIDIAQKEGINGEELQLLKTAALFHDAGFTEQELDHEEVSCRMARSVLPGFGYAPAQVDYICKMILATRIPQSPRDKLSRILCDADLDYLGRDDFFKIGARLFEELRVYKVVETERDWNELQLRFLRKHKFHTATNKRDREPMKRVHIDKVARWLEQNR